MFGLNKLSFLNNFLDQAGKSVLWAVSRMKNMEVHPDGLWGTEMRFLLGFYEAESVRMCKRFIKPGMNVIDVGGDIGYYSILFSKLVGDSGKVFVFEPDPGSFKILTKNIKNINRNNVYLVEMAVSNKSGTVDFFEMKGPGKHSLFNVSKEDDNFVIKNKISVKATTLDEFVQGHGNPKIDFIKIDIEGGEINALRGMKNVIAKSEKLIAMVEFNTRTTSAGGMDPGEYIKELSQMGFKVKEISHKGGLRDVDSQTYKLAGENYVNLLCLKNVKI